MKNIDQDFNKIQDYIDGNLSQQEAAAIKDRLEKEPDFDQLYQRSKAAIEVIRSEAEQSTMALLQSIEKSEQISLTPEAKEAKIRKFNPRRLLSIAAVLLVLVVAAVWVMLPKDQSMVAFNNYYETPAFDLQRGGSTADALLSNARNAYNQGDFATALQALKEYESSNEATSNTQIYQAIALIELDKTEEALTILNSLSEGKEQLDQVYWMKALAHLKQGDKVTAVTTLKTLNSGSI
ncbi:MAG: hypothetical protein AAF705_21865, partial [Bacteroidota bacterium]